MNIGVRVSKFAGRIVDGVDIDKELRHNTNKFRNGAKSHHLKVHLGINEIKEVQVVTSKERIAEIRKRARQFRQETLSASLDSFAGRKYHKMR